MPERKTIAAYLEAVQGQIRWKRARPLLVRELERHLEDQRDDFLKEGKAPDEAERLAVEDMGDPVTVGTELDRMIPMEFYGPVAEVLVYIFRLNEKHQLVK